MRLMKVMILAATFGTASVALACPGKDKAAKANKEHQAEKKELAKVSVKDAADMQKAGKIIMVDANGDNTRKKEGYVPGARLLTNYKTFDVKELKATKKDTLVFYCGSERCSAAPKAATIAAAKGYNAKVMDAGIKGWIKAGYPTAKL
jgi:rhodanese-related sulfurtransferase